MHHARRQTRGTLFDVGNKRQPIWACALQGTRHTRSWLVREGPGGWIEMLNKQCPLPS